MTRGLLSHLGSFKKIYQSVILERYQRFNKEIKMTEDIRRSSHDSSKANHRVIKSAVSMIKSDALRPWTGSRSFKVVEFDTEAFKPFSIKDGKQGSRGSTPGKPSRTPSAKVLKSILKKEGPSSVNDSATAKKSSKDQKSKGDPSVNGKKSLKTPSKEIPKRKPVPYDFSQNKYSHAQHCSQAPPGMITKSLAYSPRCRNTTFGKSNRIVFLRQLREEEGMDRVRPPYPPAYHGPCGEGQQFSLGLTLAGSAESERILGPICTYGKLDRKFDKPLVPTSLPVTQEKAKKVKVFDDPLTARSMQQFLILDEETRLRSQVTSPSTKSKPSHVPSTTQYPLIVHTRYSANTDWNRETKESVQAPPHSHFFISEAERHLRLPFTDVGRVSTKKGLVRDKNGSSVSKLLSISG